jgi:hypothetical protein
MNGGSNYVLWKHPIHGHHNYVLITILIEVYCDCANISYHYTPRSGKGGAAAGRDVEGLADLREGAAGTDDRGVAAGWLGAASWMWSWDYCFYFEHLSPLIIGLACTCHYISDAHNSSEETI